MTIITEFYIGLSDKDMKNQVVEFEDVEDSIKDVVKGGTFKRGTGLWNQKTENSVIFEVADFEDNSDLGLEEFKESLEKEFNQDSVMVKRYEADIMF